MMRRALSIALCALFATPVAHAQLMTAPATPTPVAAPTQTDQILAKIVSVPELERIAAKFAAENDLPKLTSAVKRLIALRPGNGHYLYTLAATYAQQGMKREAYDALVNLQTSGYAFDPTNDKRFEKVHGTEVWEYILMNLRANAAPFGEGKIAYTLPAGDLLLEAIAYDPTKKQLLAGSAREGKVYRVDAKGALQEFIAANAENGMWAVMDIAVDAPRNAIYVASSAIPHYKRVDTKDYGKAGVFKFALDTGAFQKKYLAELPPGAQANFTGITVTPSGRVFAVDGATRALFKLEGDAMKVFIANKSLTTIQAITSSDDAIYFADYELGIFGLDQKTGEPFEVMIPPKLTLFGITGMAYWNGHLIASQTGFPPKRIMRFKLSEDGRKIVSSQALAAAKPEFTAMTKGVIGGDTYYAIANTQKGKYDRFGLPKTGETLEAVKVYGTDVKFALDNKKGGEARPMGTTPPGG